MKDIIYRLKLAIIPLSGNNYRPKIIEGDFLLYLVIFIFILKLVAVPFFIYFPKSSFFADITRTSLLTLINNERKALGIEPFSEDVKLVEAAALKAEDMLEKDYFSHNTPEGFSPWYWFNLVGYNYKFAGENIAIGFVDSEEVHQALLNSESHRYNLLNSNYKEIGIAVVKGEFSGNETTVVVEMFGAKKPILAEISEVKVTTEEVPLEERKEEEIYTEPAPEVSFKEIKGVSRQEGNFAFNIFSFIFFNYESLIQKISYTSLILAVLLLIINIFVKFNIQHRDLIFKTIIFIILLSFSIIIDKDLIINFIPHNIVIY
ncbi:MAG: CAP domain-containing protein [Candidatus Pacebacteria bacterium]|nr:CAP domain-containing protein [Candidatus Paceibacterota bacterium]